MLKRITFGLIATLAMSLLLLGCGTEKPKDSADATVKAYALLYAAGDTTESAKTGMPKADIDKISEVMTQNVQQQLASFDLTDEQDKALVKVYMDTLKKNANIQAKIKTASDSEPVVELSMNRIDTAKFTQMMQNDEGLVQIGFVKGMIEAGESDATFEDYQEALTNRLGLLFENMPMKATADTLDVPCKIAKGEGDKTFWAPNDVQALAGFVSGQ